MSAVFDDTGCFVGHDPNEGCDHRTAGEHRAWCHACREWCYPHIPCVRCERAAREVDFYEYLTGIVEHEPWREYANCRGLPVDLFYAGRGEPSYQARAVCASCPVQPECFEHAQSQPERFGLWAGLSERERRRLRRRELEVVA